MPKYKVGDVAALFPKPSKPKTESGKKIQALFQEFYNKPNNPSKKWKGQEQPGNKKQQVDNVNSSENTEESKPKKKEKKRKLQNITDSGIEGNKKPKLENENEQAPFPRQKSKKEKYPKNESFPSKKKAKKRQAVSESGSPSKKSAPEINSEIKDGFSKAKPKEDAQSYHKTAPAPFPRSQFKKNKNSETEGYLPRKQTKEVRDVEMDNIFPESGSRKKKAKDPHQEVETASPEKKLKKPKKKFKRAELNSPSVQDQKSKSEKPKVLKEQKSKVVFRMKQQRVIPSCKDIFPKTNKEKDATNKVHEKKNHRKSLEKDGKKFNKEKVAETDERLSRTLFVGNLSVNTTRKSLEKLFSPFGTLESCRLRGAVPTKATIPKKIADIKRKYHAGLHSRIGYVVFNERKDAIEAMSLSGMNIDGHHIVVDRASASGQKKVYDEKRSIFVGNLPFDIEDETLWSTFLQCGDVEAVRVIRDKETGAGKGFGYVLFQKIQAKEKALAFTNLEVNGRTLRIKSVESGEKNPQNNQPTSWKNAVKRIAFKRKNNKDVNPNSRKTLKKLMKKGKQQHQKKKIANIFRDLSKK